MLQKVLAPMRLLPDSLHSHLFAVTANHMLRGQGWVKRLREVEGKVIFLHVEDLAIEFRLRIAGGRLLPAWHADPHVIIRGRHDAFVSLALQRRDPDTLFFQRRLSVEGETETGVHIKNLMDAVDYDLGKHFSAVLPPFLAGVACRSLVLAKRYRPISRDARHRAGSPTPGRPCQ